MIKGITVTLINKKEVSTDDFNRPVYEESSTEVENVLVAPESNSEILSRLELTGHKEIYILAIPKGDAHVWTDAEVVFWGKRWRTVGEPLEGIEALIPLKWNKKVRVERYGTEPESGT